MGLSSATREMMGRFSILRYFGMVIAAIFLAGCATVAWTMSTNSISAYEDFLEQYPQSKFAAQALRKLEALYFDQAKAQETIAAFSAYEDFLARYPQFIAPAWQKLEVLYFDYARETGEISAYEDFLVRHPNSEFAAPAWQKLEALYFDQARVKGVSAFFDYAYFLERHPNSEFAAPGQQKLEMLYFDYARETGKTSAYEDFLSRYPNSEFAAQARWKIARARGTISAYENFLEWHPNSEFAAPARQVLEKLYFERTEQDFERARAQGTIFAYEDFLERHPHSEFDPQVHFELAKARGTISAYGDYLNKYPQGRFAIEVKSIVQEMHNLEKAARRVLPEGTKVDVTNASRDLETPEFVIAAHLLEGHASDESDPYVRGDYGTHEKLIRFVQLRCAQIVKSVAKGAVPSSQSVLVIRVRHGVRQSFYGVGGSAVSKTLYEISIPVRFLRERQVQSMDDVSVMQLWEVRNNIIPELEFGQEFRW